MGYKKLDEVMELLTDELDSFERAVDRLERLTKDTEKHRDMDRHLGNRTNAPAAPGFGE